MEETAAVTSAIDHYDGIFKFVHGQRAKSPFLQARKLLAENKISDAIEKFEESHGLCDNDVDRKTVSLVIAECKRYANHVIPSDTENIQTIDWTDIFQRKVERFEESHDVLPQGVFMLKLAYNSHHGRLVILGRKTLSELWLQNLIPEIFCSQIRGDMILGLLSDWRFTDEKSMIYYHPFNPSEKLKLFADLVSNLNTDATGVDILYPFPLLPSSSRKELTSPPEGWDVDETYDLNLSHGEEHIRQITIDILRGMKFTSHRLYDPACSTGVFLNSLKEAFPACETIGQDLSQKMCNVAKVRVDQVHCGNAMSPKIQDGTAHCVFVRFLNSEVVTTKEAGLLLSALLPTVAKGGIMIVFGHTPVLLSADYFRNIEDFNLLRNVAVSKDKRALFQYYIIQRCN